MADTEITEYPIPVLIIAFSYPPLVGAGTKRSLNLVKNLNQVKFRPIVLTGKLTDLKKAEMSFDKGLLEPVKDEARVVRVDLGGTPKFDAFLMKYRLFRLVWTLNYGRRWEPFTGWVKPAVAAASSLIQEEEIRVVYTSSAPFSAFQIGKKLTKIPGVKWVADLRDPYTDSYAGVWPSKLFWLWDRLWEKRVLRHASCIIVNTQAVKRLFIKRKIAPENKIIVIHNGF